MICFIFTIYYIICIYISKKWLGLDVGVVLTALNNLFNGI